MILVDVIHGFETLESWRHRWEEIFGARSHEPSSSFEWTSALARHHVRVGDACVLMCLRRRAEVVGLVPLVARKSTLRMGVRATVRSPLSESCNTHSDLLLANTDDETVGAFLAGLGSLGVAWDRFSMARLFEMSPIAASLQRVAKAHAWRYSMRDGIPAYFLPLPESYGEYLKGRSAKFRISVRRWSRVRDQRRRGVRSAPSSSRAADRKPDRVASRSSISPANPTRGRRNGPTRPWRRTFAVIGRPLSAVSASPASAVGPVSEASSTWIPVRCTPPPADRPDGQGRDVRNASLQRDRPALLQCCMPTDKSTAFRRPFPRSPAGLPGQCIS